MKLNTVTSRRDRRIAEVACRVVALAIIVTAGPLVLAMTIAAAIWEKGRGRV